MIQRIYNLAMLAALSWVLYVGFLVATAPDWNGSEDMPKVAISCLGLWFIFTLFNYLVYGKVSPVLKHVPRGEKPPAEG